MCNMMDGLVPVSSLLLIRLLPSRAESSACVTGVATISWRRRRWHSRVAAIACLWCSRRAVPSSCSPSRPIRCGRRFGLLLLPLPPSACPLGEGAYKLCHAIIAMLPASFASTFRSSLIDFSCPLPLPCAWPYASAASGADADARRFARIPLIRACASTSF